MNLNLGVLFLLFFCLVNHAIAQEEQGLTYVFIEQMNSNCCVDIEFNIVELLKEQLRHENIIVLNDVPGTEWPDFFTNYSNALLRVIPRMARMRKANNCGEFSLKVENINGRVLWFESERVFGNPLRANSPCSQRIKEHYKDYGEKLRKEIFRLNGTISEYRPIPTSFYSNTEAQLYQDIDLKGVLDTETKSIKIKQAIYLPLDTMKFPYKLRVMEMINRFDVVRLPLIESSWKNGEVVGHFPLDANGHNFDITWMVDADDHQLFKAGYTSQRHLWIAFSENSIKEFYEKGTDPITEVETDTILGIRPYMESRSKSDSIDFVWKFVSHQSLGLDTLIVIRRTKLEPVLKFILFDDSKPTDAKNIKDIFIDCERVVRHELWSIELSQDDERLNKIGTFNEWIPSTSLKVETISKEHLPYMISLEPNDLLIFEPPYGKPQTYKLVE